LLGRRRPAHRIRDVLRHRPPRLAALAATGTGIELPQQVKFAFNLPNFGEFADPRVMAEVGVALEAGGWGGLFIWEHPAPAFVPGRPMPPVADATVALTAIAVATNRIRFGPMIAPLPRRRVQKIAREFGSLDLLSGGRAILGVGLGVPTDAEFEWFGEDGSDLARAQRLDESL